MPAPRQDGPSELAGQPLPATVDRGRRRQVSEIQRARILSAMVAVIAEHGIGYATVGRVVARSGVSRRTFYEQFVDHEDCLLAALDHAAEEIAAVVLPAYRGSSWRKRVRSGLLALLEFLEGEPGIARLAIVEMLGAGPKALERRRDVLSRVIAVIDREGRASREGEGPPPLTGEGVVGGVLSLIHSQLVGGEDASLLELLNPLVSMTVLPYLGAAAARREFEQPIPVTGKGTRRAATDPWRDLNMRLTYRTVRVLLAIDAHPGASNRQVGDASGIRDQGQVSKLLARLKQLDLIENATEFQLNNGPNAWTLTKRGDEVRGVVAIRV
jgi:AcrR family transcriptional regulator